jgi:hypothetical protein
MVDAVGCGTLLSGLIRWFVIDIFQISSGCNHIHSGALQLLAAPSLCTLFDIFTEFFYGD